jgi:S-methylmethionine-dependent homocysteine/selenocysteine methylase
MNSMGAGMMVSGRPYLTVGGTETYLIFLQDHPLREFCAFELFEDEEAFAEYERGFLRPTADAAAEHGFGLVVDGLVWRASPDWLEKLGYPAQDLARINRNAIARMHQFIREWRAARGVTAEQVPMLVAGEIGPRGDGYKIEGDGPVNVEAAQAYHAAQVAALAAAEVDAVGALTMTSLTETIGIVRAARERRLPVFVSPTVETDGSLPDGSSLGTFVQEIDAATEGYPSFYMVNCAHPTHLRPTLDAARKSGAAWLSRLKGLRANASTMSHEELDNSETLDAGDPPDLAARMASLQRDFGFSVLGGCCGADASHICAIAHACRGAQATGK